jgi:hypothetical protein
MVIIFTNRPEMACKIGIYNFSPRLKIANKIPDRSKQIKENTSVPGVPGVFTCRVCRACQQQWFVFFAG